MLSRMIPAHVTRMSSEPPAETAASTADSTSARSVRPQRTATPPNPFAVPEPPPGRSRDDDRRAFGREPGRGRRADPACARRDGAVFPWNLMRATYSRQVTGPYLARTVST